MAEQFTNINQGERRPDYTSQSPGYQSTQHLPNSRGKHYYANPDSYPQSHSSNNHNNGSPPGMKHGPASAPGSGPYHGRTTDGRNQQGTGSKEAYSKPYSNSRDMPPNPTSSASTGHTTHSKGSYPNPASASYKGGNASQNSLGSMLQRGPHQAEKTQNGYKAQDAETLTGLSERYKQTAQQHVSSKGAAPAPPKGQNGSHSQMGVGYVQNPKEQQGKTGNDYGRSTTSKDQSHMGGASHAQKNPNDRYVTSSNNRGHNAGNVKPREQQGRDNQHNATRTDMGRPYQNMNGDKTIDGRNKNTRESDNKDSAQRGYDNRGYVQTERRDENKKHYQAPVHHQSTTSVGYANTGKNYSNTSGNPGGKAQAGVQPDRQNNRHHASSERDIPRQIATSNLSVPSAISKDPKYQDGHPSLPHAPPRRNKSSSAVDISQGYASSNSNLAVMPEKQSVAYSGSDKHAEAMRYQSMANSPQNQPGPNYAPNHTPSESKSSSSRNDSTPEATSVPRDRVLSDSSNNKRKYERHATGTNTGKNVPSSAPSAKRRDRMSSSSQPATGYHGTATQGQRAQYFDPTPPDRAMSMVVIPQAGSSGLSSHTIGRSSQQAAPPLARASSLPTISQQVSQTPYNTSMSAINNNPNLYRSKSLLSVALQGTDNNMGRSTTNLRHAASLRSLVASNPNLARTAATYAIYELQLEKGIIPKDHNQTFVLSIVSLLILPPISWIFGALCLFFTALSVTAGCVLYPFGWEKNLEMQQACGSEVSVFRLARCSISWAYWLTIGGASGTLLCSLLACHANKPETRIRYHNVGL